MVAVAIMAILASIAAPGMREYIASSRVTAAASDLLSTLTHARNEAIRRGKPVTVAAIGGAWQQGWASTVGATVLSAAGATSSDIQIKNNLASVTFNTDGSTANTGAIDVSSSSGYSTRSRKLQILASGKAFVSN